MKKLCLTVILMSLFLVGCKSTSRQAGGLLDVVGKIGSANVQQPENAKETAVLDYSEDGVTIPMNTGDELKVIVDKTSTGSIRKEIEFKPKNKSEVEVSNVTAKSNTGSSYEDLVGQLKVFMDNIKIN